MDSLRKKGLEHEPNHHGSRHREVYRADAGDAKAHRREQCHRVCGISDWCDENNERWAEALDSGCAIAIEKFIADWNGRADAGRWKHAAQADDNVWDNELK